MIAIFGGKCTTGCWIGHNWMSFSSQFPALHGMDWMFAQGCSTWTLTI